MPTADGKIVFLSAHTGLGGAEGYMDRLIRRMPAHLLGSAVFLGDGPAVERLETAGIKVISLPRGRRFQMLAGLPRLRRTLKDLDPAVIHANGILAATMAALALPFSRIPIVWLKVDFAGEGTWASLLTVRCRIVTGISHAVISDIWRPMRGRTRVVHCGLPAYDFDRHSARRGVLELTGWPADSEVVLVSGRLATGKGQLELVEAAPAITAARPNTRFLLLGSEDPFHAGYEQRLMERARALGVEDRIAVREVPHEHDDPAFEAVRVTAGCDVVVVPSMREEPYGWREGFGLVGAEAFAVGTPVVAYRNGSLPEVLGDCARMADEGDREALAAAVIEILSDPELGESMASCGQKLANERYQLDRAVSGMLACYREAAPDQPLT